MNIRSRIERVLLLDLLHQLLVLVVRVLGDEDPDDAELVAFLAAALDAAAFDAQLGVTAGAGRDGDRDGTFQRGDFDLRAEQGLVNADGDVEQDVEVLAAEVGMGVNVRDDVQVAGRAVGLLAHAFDADAASFLDAGGDFDVDGFELPVAVDLEREGGSAGGLGEGEGDGVLEVGAARRGLLARAGGASAGATEACAGASGPAAGAEQLLEDVTEVPAAFEVLNIDTGADAPGVGSPAPAATLLCPAE